MENLQLKLKLTHDGQKRLINWFGKQNDEVKLKICAEKRNQFFKLKQNLNEKIEVMDYMSFIFAIIEIRKKFESINKKNKSKSLDEITNISELEVLTLKKVQKREKYDAIVNRSSIIKRLRNENISWRNISQIFKVKYRLNLSHQYIKCIYEELEDGL